MNDVMDEYNKRLPYWEYMRVSEPNELSLNSTDLSVLVGDLAARVEKLEEELQILKDR
jgi:hypothetical protein